MSRSGLFRAAALLAAGVSPLLVGAASAAETPDLKGIAPEAAAAEKVAPLIQDASKTTNPLDAAKGVKLPSVKAPVANPAQVKAPEAPAAERSLPAGLPGLPVPADLPAPGDLPIGTLPTLPDTNAVPDAKVGDVKVPAVSKLPGVESVQGQLPPLG
ncbi:hypothetical protein FKR81_13455 [Lentzea tibetensis]|uniref:ATP-binding protein n=1 Tax=Lentzea tibetensis TaxID=2591470 RepID=A0A563EW22_9PSEU|nr:hypothetical protein [Lentzea tibetensis]TWP51853.1 hypothetical protein FKR81_13455 [Lentzea tibetensis]